MAIKTLAVIITPARIMVNTELAPIDRPISPTIEAVYCGLRLKR